ncbi:hypothetical protein KOR42_18680 [Thalassoglobus neptunius]|uniref:Uncharacterized protein n=1 Tax=Thalassoglobus neptunius TaxID=1938619 RepID=A0A5C5X871_9PLAN|nr:hypothetical protein [Thalassoglobus neptunius]TWT58493.1 hypothetical protein KOR42_18680 [Thalassoglobus neptunius]
MAKCDEGYVCEICGEYVHKISDSDLYLRYIIGEIDSSELLASPERHLRCNPTLTQFIVDDSFPPVKVDGPFSKSELDPEDVKQREDLVTRGFHRLREVQSLGIAISDYPLPEVLRRKQHSR